MGLDDSLQLMGNPQLRVMATEGGADIHDGVPTADDVELFQIHLSVGNNHIHNIRGIAVQLHMKASKGTPEKEATVLEEVRGEM